MEPGTGASRRPLGQPRASDSNLIPASEARSGRRPRHDVRCERGLRKIGCRTLSRWAVFLKP